MSELAIMLVYSNDGGATFSKPVKVSPAVTYVDSSRNRVVQGSIPAVGLDGTVYVAYYDRQFLSKNPLRNQFSKVV